MNGRILIVEDNQNLVVFLADRLHSEGYHVTTAADGNKGVELALSGQFDLIILDIMLPGLDGINACKEIRNKGLDLPVLMLTARNEVFDKVLGLKIGADDYLTKPFEMAELLARIEVLLRRRPPAGSSGVERYRFGNCFVDFARAELTVNNEHVDLTATELKLLRIFINNRDIVLSRNDLLDRVWGYDALVTTRTVDVHVASLRKKIENKPSHPVWIQTVHGIGYRFAG